MKYNWHQRKATWEPNINGEEEALLRRYLLLQWLAKVLNPHSEGIDDM
jgi:hypothetical protein